MYSLTGDGKKWLYIASIVFLQAKNRQYCFLNNTTNYLLFKKATGK